MLDFCPADNFGLIQNKIAECGHGDRHDRILDSDLMDCDRSTHKFLSPQISGRSWQPDFRTDRHE